MKQTIGLTCATCGVKFTAEADYFIPGISGHTINEKGEELIFIDPKAEHHCKNCIDKALKAALNSAFGLPANFEPSVDDTRMLEFYKHITVDLASTLDVNEVITA